MKEYLALMFGLVFVQNFVLSQFLGLCPFLGVSKKKSAALGMGAAVIFVMTLACVATFLFYFYALMPLGAGEYLDIVGFILIIASLVQFVELVVKKLSPSLYEALGIYLPLITCNCVIFARAEMYAQKNGVFNSTLDAVGMGIGFTGALVAMATVREIFGSGTWYGIALPVLSSENIPIFTMAPGGFAVFGLLIALINKLTKRRDVGKKDFACEGCPSAAVCTKRQEQEKSAEQ